MKKPFRVVAAGAIVLAGICFVLALYIFALSDKNAAERDFISYWATGQRLVQGQNPYDFDAVRRLERAEGREASEPVLMMRNPPMAFFIAYPLGFFTPKTALILWLFLLLGGLGLAIYLIWRMNGSPPSRFHLMGFMFAPALACFQAGQFGIFLLLGVVLFLYFHRSRPYLAGAALLLCSLKPHLFLPFLVVLVLWSVTQRNFCILAGGAAALAASCALSYGLDRDAWAQYAAMMHGGTAMAEIVPTLSAYLRLLVAPQRAVLQYLAQALACVWAGVYFWTRRARWNWLDHGLVVLLVGAMCTPYGWLTDESMLLPAVLGGLYAAIAGGRRVWPLAVIAGAALIELFANVEIITPGYLWTTLAWLGWYLYATGRFGGSGDRASAGQER